MYEYLAFCFIPNDSARSRRESHLSRLRKRLARSGHAKSHRYFYSLILPKVIRQSIYTRSNFLRKGRLAPLGLVTLEIFQRKREI